jgi:predicted GNAT superfamily acetyltransferase
MMRYIQYDTLPPEPLLGTLLDLLMGVFTNQTRTEWLTDLTAKATYPSFQLLLTVDTERVVGCKIGYEHEPGTFYSWLGCVSLQHRGRGIAAELMRQQHEAARAAGYMWVRTHTYNHWRDMLILNLRHGFAIVGTQPGKRGLMILLEKAL